MLPAHTATGISRQPAVPDYGKHSSQSPCHTPCSLWMWLTESLKNCAAPPKKCLAPTKKERSLIAAVELDFGESVEIFGVVPFRRLVVRISHVTVGVASGLM